MNWYKRVLAGGLPVYDFRELTNKLRKEYGIQYLRPGKGDDQIWGDPEKGISSPIPYRAGTTDINPQTTRDILNHLSIPLNDFKKKQKRKKRPLPTVQQYNLNDSEPSDPITEKPVKNESYKQEPWWIEQQRRIGLDPDGNKLN